MQLSKALELIRTYRFYISIKDFSEALCLTDQAVRKRLKGTNTLQYSEAFMLAEKYSLPIRLFFEKNNLPTSVKIEYFKKSGFDLYVNPDFDCYYMDTNIFYSYRKDFNPNNFKVISMIGDRLNGGELWIKDRDVILLDTTRKDLKYAGMYCYTCSDNYINFAWVEECIDGVHFKFYNPEEEVIKQKDYLDSIKFNVEGRVIKNLNFFA